MAQESVMRHLLQPVLRWCPRRRWGAHLVVKVEPQQEELRFLRDDMVLFTYLHLAAYPSVVRC